jgi:hypothetical protein
VGFPSLRRGFDSLHPLHLFSILPSQCSENAVKDQNFSLGDIADLTVHKHPAQTPALENADVRFISANCRAKETALNHRWCDDA